jgi:DNA-binding SARP family transcriptional activator
MEFGLLGPLVVRCAGQVVPIAGGRQRAVLAALLLDAGRVVPAADLAAALWGPAPPLSARVSVQNYVRRLPAPTGRRRCRSTRAWVPRRATPPGPPGGPGARARRAGR